MVVENVLVGGVEDRHHVEDPLGYLGNESFADLACPEVQHLHASCGRSIETVPPILGQRSQRELTRRKISYFRASSIPTRNALDEFLLRDVDKIALIHIYHCYYRWLIWQGDQFENLLEAGVLEAELDQVARLHVEDVEITRVLVSVVADNVLFVRAHHDLDEGRELVLELPLDLSSREGARDNQGSEGSSGALLGHNHTSGLAFVEEYLLDVFLSVLEYDFLAPNVPVEQLAGFRSHHWMEQH